MGGTTGSDSSVTPQRTSNATEQEHREQSIDTVRKSTLELEDVLGARAGGDGEITAAQRMLAACSGSLLTSLLGNPATSPTICANFRK
jgi:hypothetical protein